MRNTQPIKIYFASFWKGFDPYNNFFLDILSKEFQLVVEPKNPDVLIHSIFNKEYLKYNCIRVGYTGENTRPDFKRSDYYIGFDYLNNDRYLRWPLFLFATPLHQLQGKKNIDEIIAKKKKFAAFVVSNPNAKERIEFFKKLNQYKKVSSGGKVLNNIGHQVKDLDEFLGQHKFTIAFENSSYPGYTTEKLTQAMRVNSIPIYWGNPKIGEEFNTKSFVNLHDYTSFDDAINYIIEIDSNQDLYKKIISESWFKNNKINDEYKYKRLFDFFDHILSNKKLKQRQSSYVLDRLYLEKERVIRFLKKLRL